MLSTLKFTQDIIIILGTFIANPLLWFLTKSAERGAQTPLYVATAPDLGQPSGLFCSIFKTFFIIPVNFLLLDFYYDNICT